MYPTLRDGESIRIDPTAYEEALPAIGDIVLARHPYKKGVWMIKRVVGLAGGGRYLLRGDNVLESSDSRSFGPIRLQDIRGRATHRDGGMPLRSSPQTDPP